MIKKIFISFLLLIIISSNVVYSYEVSANSNPYVPPAVQGYDEALFTSFMAGVGAITAGAMHTTESINKMRDFAVENWPAFKDSFSNAVTWTGDQIIIAGNWIENVLMPTMANSDDLTQGDIIPGPYNNALTKRENSWIIYVKSGYVLSINNETYRCCNSLNFEPSKFDAMRQLEDGSYDYGYTLRFGSSNSYTRYGYSSLSAAREARENLLNSVANSSNPSAVISFLRVYGGYSISLEYNGDLIDTTTPSIYNQVDNWFRQKEAYENGLVLGIPQSAPYTPTGRALEYDDVLGTLTLDGVPYTGEVDWKTLANLGLNIPAIPLTLAGLPVFYLGDGVFVDQHGNVITSDKVGDITVGYPDILADGTNVYVRTQTGDLINLKTGEIVTTGDLDVPSIPVVPTIPIEYSGEFATPTTTIDWNPLLMAGRGLTEKFPFSIPFDFYRQLQVFDVEPKAPEFKINLSNYFTIDGHQQSMNFEISFEQFDAIATIFRWFILILFDIGLILAIRRIMPE